METIQIKNSQISAVMVSSKTEKKQICGKCRKKVRYLFTTTEKNLCSSCCLKINIDPKEINQCYNLVYVGKNPIETKETKSLSNMELTKLYTEGWINGNNKSINDFLDSFQGLIYKYSKYTSRDHDFDDLKQIFKYDIIKYHARERLKFLHRQKINEIEIALNSNPSESKKEKLLQELQSLNPKLKKMRIFDYSDPQNLGALIQATKDFVLNTVNKLRSKKSAFSHQADYSSYTPLEDCWKLHSEVAGVDCLVDSKIMFQQIDELCQRHLSDSAYEVYMLQKKGYSEVNEIAHILCLAKNIVINAKQEIKQFWRSSIMVEYRTSMLS